MAIGNGRAGEYQDNDEAQVKIKAGEGSMSESKFPTGVRFLYSLMGIHRAYAHQLVDTPITEFLGTSMSALHRVATCHGKCRQGDHILESLAGRAYNLAASSLSLIQIGYYDEALNLTRSLGEIANVLGMLAENPDLYLEWVVAPKRERISGKFSPGRVRALAEAHDLPAPMTAKKYAELCESVTHVTPQTAPNAHNEKGQKYIGGVFQEAGYSKALNSLCDITVMIALMASRMVGRYEIFEEVAAAIETYDQRQAKGNGESEEGPVSSVT